MTKDTDRRMRIFARLLSCLLLTMALVPIASAQVAQPQRPFSQLIDLWQRQLDRIGERMVQSGLLTGEFEVLRDQIGEIRSAAAAAAGLARDALADDKKLLAPLEIKPTDPKAPADTPPAPESEGVKAERARLTEQAAVSEGRVKQCEVVIARADQLLDRLTKLRDAQVLQNLLHKGPSPLSRQAWSSAGTDLRASLAMYADALASWSQSGLQALRSGDQDLTPIGMWSILTLALWWAGRWLSRRFGRGEGIEPAHRDRALAAAIDGLGLVLVPILATWLIGKLLLASAPPPAIETMVPQVVAHVVGILLVFGMTATMLAPNRPAWRAAPFSNASARHLSTALRRLIVGYSAIDLAYLALTQGAGSRESLASIGALVMATAVGLLALPILSTRSWEAARAGEATPPEGAAFAPVIGGKPWAAARAVLSIAVLAPIVFALFGYATLASQIHSALAASGLAFAVALLAHGMAGDLLEAAASPDTPPGRWIRHRLSLTPDAEIRGHHFVLLLVDAILLALLGVVIPTVWGVDIDSVLGGFGRLLTGVKIGGVTISLINIGSALAAFALAVLLVRVVRGVIRDRVLPTVNAPLPLRQSIDAGLNYIGLMIAVLIGVTSLGVDFSNLALILGALSVGIGLGLQNIANNIISGVILLLERPIKAGDWVEVGGHEGFVRRINIRATEIETFKRTTVIVPNSLFLQNPVINRTYADTSSRVEISLSVAYGSDVAKVEAILREVALEHPRVLRVPAPIVRFLRLSPNSLDFELYAFVARLEDRLVVANDLNRTILERITDAGIEIPFADGRPRPREVIVPPPTAEPAADAPAA
jgi:small-conductance mechanosensitive channel